MKKLLSIIALLLLASCTNCQQEADELYQDYLNAVRNANGNPDAIHDIHERYTNEKNKLGC